MPLRLMRPGVYAHAHQILVKLAGKRIRASGILADADHAEILQIRRAAVSPARSAGIAGKHVGVLVSPIFEQNANQDVAKSGIAVLARIMAPAALSFLIAVASSAGHVAILGDRTESRHRVLSSRPDLSPPPERHGAGLSISGC